MPLIVISGVDGCGKTTQLNLLKNNLIRLGKKYGEDFTDIKFPRYHNPSAKMVEYYLGGKFGDKPEDVPSFLASSFYAIDRALSFIQEPWGELYREGKIIISDRFYESNIVHQTAKQITTESSNDEVQSKIMEILAFENKIEHEYFGVPNWDLLFFLVMNPDTNWNLLQYREHMAGDIHERDRDYFNRCHMVVKNMRSILPNTRYINVCDYNGSLLTPEAISNEIFSLLYKENII